jgi:N-acetylmuramoyl-L-alanine amidase
MSTGLKNGKLHTNNIYSVKLIFIVLLNIFVTVSGSAIKDDKGWVIVIDAGHGGKDPGAKGSFSQEKDIVLAVALKTGEYIKKNIRNVTVIYTRKNDTFVELQERANIANRNNADLFISIHANWAKSKNVHGAETYIMGITKDQANLEVAMKENEVMTKYEGIDPKSAESFIMLSLTQKVFEGQSTDLATKIQKQFREQSNRNDRDVKQAGFWVLFTTKMPSVLIETGFITSPSEEKYLSSKDGQDNIALSIYRACREYITEIDNRSVSESVRNSRKQPAGIAASPEKAETIDTIKQSVASSSGILFMVQIASSSSRTEILPENFKGLKDIIELNIDDRYKYATGRFTEFSEANEYAKELQKIYPDAFVIAVKGDKILPLHEAIDQTKKINQTVNEKDLK